MAKRFLSNINVNDQYTLPSADGTSGQIIQTDGSGNLSFVDFASDEARKIVFTVKNKDSISLSKGTVVHASPSATPPSGNVIEVIRADNDDSSKMPAIGVLNETLAVDAEGECVMLGSVSGIATNSFAVGDELYVSDTPGEFTNTKPTGTSNLIQKIAIVIKSHSTNGLIEVFGAGRSNDVPNQIDRNVNFTDNSRLTFGSSTTPNLQIYHDTNNSWVRDTNDGNLYLDTNGNFIGLVSDASFSNGKMGLFYKDGAVELYYDNSKKFETTSSGIDVTGNTTVSENVFVGESNSTDNYVKVFHSDNAYSEIHGFGIQTDRTAYYLRPVNDGTQTLYIGGFGADLDWSTIQLKFNSDVDFVKNGSTIMTITDKVGIGTTSPSYKLEVTGIAKIHTGIITDVGVPLKMIVNNGALNDSTELRTGSGEFKLYSGRYNSTHQAFVFATGDNYTSGSERMRITSGGNVGIGTTTIGARLEVAATATTSVDIAHFSNSNSVQKAIFKLSGVGAGQLVLRDAGNVEDVLISSHGDSYFNGGSVGIGTDSPQNKLDIYSNENVPLRVHRPSNANLDSSGAWGIGFSTRNDAVTSTNDVRAGIFSYYNGNLFFATNTTDIEPDPDASARMTITSGGYVGIGTTSPGARLDVVGAGNAIQIRRSNGYASIKAHSDNGGHLILDSEAGAVYINNYVNKNVYIATGGGNVGIGTTSPSDKLDVSGSGNMGIRISNTGNLSTDYSVIRFYQNSSEKGVIYTNQEDLYLRAPSGDILLQHTGGNVGIGTTAPSEKLQVNGNIRIAGVGSSLLFDTTGSNGSNGIKTINDYETLIYNGRGSAGFAVIGNSNIRLGFGSNYSAAETDLFIASTGNVGIGTSSPSTVLDVRNSINIGGAGQDSNIYFQQNTSNQARINYYTDNSMYFDNWSGGYYFRTTSSFTPRVTILNGGNVGIGTTSPTAKLTVVENASGLVSSITNSNSSGSGVQITAGNGTNNSLQVRNYAGGELMRVQGNGNVGIGVSSPSQKLEVNGNVLINGAAPYISIKTTQTGTPDWKIYNSYNTVGDFAIVGGSSVGNKFNIQPNGNVGIGTTSPSYKLDVSGGAKIDGKVIYTVASSDLDTTGVAVAGITSGLNGASCTFVFQMGGGGSGGYQKIVYNCTNSSGTWSVSKDIDEGGNRFDVTASNGSTVTFTFKARSATQYYTPRILVEAFGSNINNTYA